MAKLFFFGDSITAGVWDERGGWAARLIGKIMADNMEGSEPHSKGFYCLPYNLGISGNTSVMLSERMAQEIEDRKYKLFPDEPLQVVIAIGTNDAALFGADKHPMTREKDFRQALEKIITIATQQNAKIMLVGLTPVDEDKTNPVPFAPDFSYTNDQARRYEAIIAEIAAKHNLAFIPIFEDWYQRADYKSLLGDGLHPNSAGHALLADQIGRALLSPDFYAYHCHENKPANTQKKKPKALKQ